MGSHGYFYPSWTEAIAPLIPTWKFVSSGVGLLVAVQNRLGDVSRLWKWFSFPLRQGLLVKNAPQNYQTIGWKLVSSPNMQSLICLEGFGSPLETWWVGRRFSSREGIFSGANCWTSGGVSFVMLGQFQWRFGGFSLLIDQWRIRWVSTRKSLLFPDMNRESVERKLRFSDRTGALSTLLYWGSKKKVARDDISTYYMRSVLEPQDPQNHRVVIFLHEVYYFTAGRCWPSKPTAFTRRGKKRRGDAVPTYPVHQKWPNGAFKYFSCSPRKLGKICILTSTFQRGWNNQLDMHFHFPRLIFVGFYNGYTRGPALSHWNRLDLFFPAMNFQQNVEIRDIAFSNRGPKQNTLFYGGVRNQVYTVMASHPARHATACQNPSRKAQVWGSQNGPKVRNLRMNVNLPPGPRTPPSQK